jgi:RNA-directed DNA polymerase
MNTASKPMYGWETIPWTKALKEVSKLQKRIYQASLRGDKKAVRKLQRLLTKSWYGRLLAVRRVTQDNQGRKTPGIDGVVIIDPKQKFKLAQMIHIQGKPQPVKRVYIPKPGNQKETRPLGIPVIRDRAEQAVVKLALEPEWEAKFEPNSYGFRPGRGCHDAVEAIFGSLKRPKFVIDADISKCFDRIDHEALLNKLDTFPLVRRRIKGWLKAGVMEGDVFYPSDSGASQGSICSPLLANVALHGLENEIEAAFPTQKKVNGQLLHWKPQVIRYADDFVILHRDASSAEAARSMTEIWLGKMGLELKPEKTKFVHTVNRQAQEKPGFDFLGFTIRQFPQGKKEISTPAEDTPQRLKRIIKPSKSGIERHVAKLRGIIHSYGSSDQENLIYALNPVIRGWSNYYSTVVSKETFGKIEHVVFQMLWAWAKRRHPKKSRHWIYERYWIRHRGTLVFKDKDSPPLFGHKKTPIQRHVKVQGMRSPFDGDWLYWATRMGRYPGFDEKMARALKKQQGKCAICGLYFTELDLPIVGKIEAKDRSKAYILVHSHCQQKKYQ